MLGPAAAGEDHADWCRRIEPPDRALTITGTPDGARAVTLADIACVDLRRDGILCMTVVRGRALYLNALLLDAHAPQGILNHMLAHCRGEQSLDKAACRFAVRMPVYTAHDEDVGGRTAHRLMGREIDIRPLSCAD